MHDQRGCLTVIESKPAGYANEPLQATLASYRTSTLSRNLLVDTIPKNLDSTDAMDVAFEPQFGFIPVF